ncbi:MAG: mechanosensitive ion channel family protein, partial [Magnetococcales bacterium]|nr:mechanosensitive ion channel family protein [Magnetococcales bacterium]
FRNLLTNAGPQDNRGVLTARIDNEKLSQRVAVEVLKELEAEQEFEKQTVGIRDRRLELAQLAFDRLQQEINVYQEALNKSQNRVLRVQDAEINRKNAAIETATSQDALLVATWEAKTARLRRNVTSATAVLNEIRTTLSDLEDKLKSEREELKNLRAMVGKGSDLNELASEIFKNAYHRVNNTRKEIQSGADNGELEQRIKEARSRYYEIIAQLPGLRNQWQAEIGPAGQGMSEAQLKSFSDKAEKVFNSYRMQLAEEKAVLLEISLQGQRLKLLPIERKEVLSELETFILARIFWVQDDAPVGWPLVGQLLNELFSLERPYSLIRWWLDAFSLDTLSTLLHFVQTGRMALLGGLLLVVLPVLFLWLHRHLDRAARPRSRQTPTTEAESHWSQARRHTMQLLAIAISPLYYLAVAFAIDSVGFPAALGIVVSRSIVHFALFLLLWRLNVFFLRPPALMAASGAIPEDICHDLYRAFRLVLWTALIFLLPWKIFSTWPFQFEVVPRFGLTVFQVAVMVAIARLIRYRSSLVQRFLGSGHKTHLLTHNWNLIILPAWSFMVLIVGMDLAGYRFGAHYLAINGLLSFLTIILMTGLFRIIALVSENVLSRREEHGREWGEIRPGYPKTEHIVRQIQGPLSWMVFVGGTLALASYWGINESVLRSMSDVTLYSVTGADGQLQFVSLADWSSFLFFLFFVFWIARRLPHLFDWLVFLRMNIDPGMRYAIVTMTRYLVVLTGIFVAFSFLKLDLAKIGWLAAAISVGLGFGLQEIVANFVSGIILLVERPIRVDDLITVGSMSGRITRINIRATTLRNFDQQEILIPNKQLITQEVTNWTLGDTRIRLVIPIDVAYGTDVDRVSVVLEDLARSHPDVLSAPPPEVYFLSHGDSSLHFELRVFLNHPDLRLPVQDRLNKLINKRFALENIEIPFPQREIRIRGGSFVSNLS